MVEHLAMIGTRLAIPEQEHQKSTNILHWHDSRAVTDELPRLGGLKSEMKTVMYWCSVDGIKCSTCSHDPE